MSTTHEYEYIPLEDPEMWIRLLRLSPSTEDHPELRGELITCRREEAPPYQPVSYTWGRQDPTSTMLLRNDGDPQCSCPHSGAEHRPVMGSTTQSTSDVDNLSLLTSRPTGLDVRATECIHTTWRRFHIRPNLEAMLQQFRNLSGSKVFWVDAICIDQTNNSEKGHQVRNMDKIYRDKRLLIWLGEPTDDSNVVLDLIESVDRLFKGDEPEEIQEEKAIQSLLAQSASTWKAFREFTGRPWFTRRWIVQEVVLSGHKHAYVGGREFCFKQIILFCDLIRNQRLYLSKDEHEYSECREIGENSPSHAHGFQAPILDPIDNLSRLWDVSCAAGRKESGALTLEKLLDNFASFESHDPRDGIYAFISMASDINRMDWFPDYSTNQTVTDVYSQAVLHIMRSGDLIVLPAGGFLADTIRGLGAPGRIVYSADKLNFQINGDEWKSLPGMKEIDLDQDGRFGDKFFRALTGNRSIVDDRVCHIPEEDLKVFKESPLSRKIPTDVKSNLASSVTFMLCNSRRFATTEGSLGFVPYEARVGDRIAVLMGCSVPVVIRAWPSAPAWVLMGECYIEGLMEGEYMEVVRELNLSHQDIYLI
ncbi:ankyrin and het domain protein [Colletotrichum chrysophilum]|uniref:Ankyrin and het domain protein n=1 Tax=Colletotrichum chrysophilum TaxID=1836956 RepID=A0AAD9A9X8_9PEZI|nr:ankyrin and het domain protein [Colletotrichum chrysophilum]